MSSIIIGDVMAVKLKNGKVLPFVLSAESNVRTYKNSYDWQWHNIYDVNNHNNFMFDNVKQIQEIINRWAESRSVKFKNGRFITTKGMNKILKNAFAKPILFACGLLQIDYIKISEDRTKAERVSFKPNTEDDFLTYMENNKNRTCFISISLNE